MTATGLIPTRHVYFSLTEDNPFLPKWYIEQLKDDLDPKLAERMLRGRWIEITTDVVYHQYGAHNFRPYAYDIDVSRPIQVCFDFNIGVGKPLSFCLNQYVEEKDEFHFFEEVIIEGASTEEACEEAWSRGLFDYDTLYRVHGDSTGGARSTKSKMSDYDLIRKFLANHRRKDGNSIHFELDVPLSNPPVRTRHNVVNAYCRSSSGKTRLFVYKGAPTLDEGFRLTALRKGGTYVEDDSKRFQHVTTAAGYSILRLHRAKKTAAPLASRKIR